MTNENMILDINGLTKEYADFKLDSVDIKLEKGMIMGLVGENGARYILKIVSTT